MKRRIERELDDATEYEDVRWKVVQLLRGGTNEEWMKKR
jgi:hypothetical protein